MSEPENIFKTNKNILTYPPSVTKQEKLGVGQTHFIGQ
jgi:hypothetical protein